MIKKGFLPYTLSISLISLIVGTSSTYAESEKIEFNAKYDTPSFIIENLSKSHNPASIDIKSNQDIIYSYISSNRNLFKLDGNVKESFKFLSEKKDGKNYYYKLIQVFNDVPVYGSDISVALDQSRNVKSFFGQVIPNLQQNNLPSEPQISKEKALSIAKQQLQKHIGSNPPIDNETIPELYIYENNNQFYLSYLIKISTSNPIPSYWHFYIDAITGNVIESYNAINNVSGTGTGVTGKKQQLEVTYRDNLYYLADQTRGNGITTFDAENQDRLTYQLLSQLYGYTGKEITSPTPHFSDPAAVDAHANAAKVYDYYKKTFNRNSFDNQGAKINSTVHVGNQWNSASWNGVQLVYGDGDGEKFISLSGSLDIVAHEITHAITQYTARLQNTGESGALNESISDIMAVMVDREDWEIGEDVYTPKIQKDALRSLKDPARYGNPDHYSKRYIGIDDNGGIHINSGINNKAAYLISEGGKHYGIKVKGIGREKTEQIYYRALNYYLTSTSDFKMMKQAAIQSAMDLYGENSKEQETVVSAYNAVGIE